MVSQSNLVFVSQIVGSTNGPGRAAVDIVRSLLASGASVTVVSMNFHQTSTLLQGGGTSSLKCVRAPSYSPFPSPTVRRFPVEIASWVLDRFRNPARRQQLRKLEPDLAVINGWGSYGLLRNGEIRPKKGKVFIVHGSPDFFRTRSKPIDLDGAVSIMEKCSHLVFVSSRCQDEWLSMPTLAGKKSFYIPNCCDEQAVAALLSQDRLRVRQRLGIPADRFVAVCVASIQRHKGQDMLLDNLTHALGAIPDILVYLVGREVDSIMARDLRDRIKTSNLTEHVLILGERQDALEFMCAADVLVLPSRTEGMPLTILEAMALKTPVVASNVGGIPELIDDGVTGILFSPDQPANLVNALAWVGSHPHERRVLAERASERYWSNFSQALHAKRYAEAVRTVLE